MSYDGQLYSTPKYSGKTFSANGSVALATSSVNVTDNGNFQMSLQTTSTGTNDNLGFYYFTAPATPYVVTACIVYNPGTYNVPNSPNNTIAYGLGFFDSNNKATTIMSKWNGATITLGLTADHWPNFNSPTKQFGGTFVAGTASGLFRWFAVKDDGSNIYFYNALGDGDAKPTHWVQFYSEGRSSYLSSPANVGLCFDVPGNINGASYCSRCYYEIKHLTVSSS